MFLGACTFIIAVCSTPLPNAVFGSSFIPSTRSAIAGKSAFSGAVLVRGWLPHAPGHGGWLRFRLVNCFACLLAALAWLAALVPFPVWVLRLNRIPRLLSVWFFASRGHHFALGTGGLKLSLLVGGLGPVYSLPKYCFKPFRNFQASTFIPLPDLIVCGSRINRRPVSKGCGGYGYGSGISSSWGS